jgi:NADH-quinone oxidoreductase subunit H
MGAWNYFVDLVGNVRADWLQFLHDQGLATSLIVFLDALLGATLILMLLPGIVIIMIWLERRFIAWMQLRPGPNRCGPLGLIQPIADVVKLLFKGTVTPARRDKIVYFAAPVIAVFAAMMVFAVVPSGRGPGEAINGFGAATFGSLADLNIGLLYIVAIGSLSTVGILMAGWGSDNKWSLLGAMRSVAQMVSYEVPMILSLIGVVLIVGSLQIGEIVGQQSIPFILIQPLGFLIYFLGAMAELNRSPMDQTEAESELTTGYFTEYSSMRFGTFFLGEYIATLAVAAIVTTVFLSGWKGPVLPVWLWYLIKVFAVFTLILWMRATLVRIRIDQIMALSWKFFVPMALINIFVTAGEVLIWEEWMSGWSSFPWPFIFLNWAIAAILILFWAKVFFKLGGGRVEVGEVRDRYCQGYGANPSAPLP